MKEINITLESFFDDSELKVENKTIRTNTKRVREIFNNSDIVDQELFSDEISFVNNASDEDLKKEIESKKSKFFMIKNTVKMYYLELEKKNNIQEKSINNVVNLTSMRKASNLNLKNSNVSRSVKMAS